MTLGAPTLGRSVSVGLHRSVEIIGLFLDRSQMCPLTANIELRWRDGGTQDELFQTRSLLALVVPHAYRWRSLEIVMSEGAVFEVVRQVLGGCIAPFLSHLGLECTGHKESTPLPLILECPRLRSAACDDYRPLPEVLTLRHLLFCLSLAGPPIATVDPLPNFPELKILALKVRQDAVEEMMTLLARAQLPSLSFINLVICSQSFGEATHSLLPIDLPTVTHLYLRAACPSISASTLLCFRHVIRQLSNLDYLEVQPKFDINSLLAEPDSALLPKLQTLACDEPLTTDILNWINARQAGYENQGIDVVPLSQGWVPNLEYDYRL